MKRVRLLVTLSLLMLSLCAYGQGVEKVKDSIESKTSYNSIIDMLRGEPGVSIIGSGDDGTMPTMYIRGIGTNSKNFQPLFVVDGVRTEDILYVQPENVHSITVIKDGTASIYGMEGANGVIEIRTKGAVDAEKEAAKEKQIIRKKARQERKAKKNSK